MSSYIKVGVFHADPLGKVDEIASEVFDDPKAAEERAEELNHEEEEYNAGPDYNPSWRSHSWFTSECDSGGIPLEEICTECSGDSRYCQCPR